MDFCELITHSAHLAEGKICSEHMIVQTLAILFYSGHENNLQLLYNHTFQPAAVFISCLLSEINILLSGSAR